MHEASEHGGWLHLPVTARAHVQSRGRSGGSSPCGLGVGFGQAVVSALTAAQELQTRAGEGGGSAVLPMETCSGAGAERWGWGAGTKSLVKLPKSKESSAVR